MLLNFISWNFDPEIVSLPALSPRWYGLLFALVFYFGYLILKRIFKKEGVGEKVLDSLTLYVVLGTLLGARLGHVFFYGPLYTDAGDGYLQDPLSILNIREGGLASHGAAIGILIALYLFFRKNKEFNKGYLWLVDRLVIAVMLGGALVRLGNFTNSEIIGQPSESPLAVVFAQNSLQYLDYYLDEEEEVKLTSYELTKIDSTSVYEGRECQVYELSLSMEGSKADLVSFVGFQLNMAWNHKALADKHLVFDPLVEPQLNSYGTGYTTNIRVYGIPRHPAQLYESFSYLIIFLILLAVYRKYGADCPGGLLLGLFLALVFSARFAIEFLKENQVSFESELTLNMGQYLSIPFVFAGIALVFYALRFNKRTLKGG